MSLKLGTEDAEAPGVSGKTRRRGAALEQALLKAAWRELLRSGYSAFTLDGVAREARTSRPVITRRWPTRGDLALAAFNYHLESRPLDVPDRGDIRAELIDYIIALYERDFPVVMMMWTQMDEYYREANSSPARFRETLLAGRVSAIGFLLERAAERGQVDPSKLTKMVVSVPAAFLAFITATQADTDIRAAVEEMIDTVLLPLVGTATYLQKVQG